MENWWVNALWSITPTAVIGVFFAIVLRLILRADRTERRIYNEMEAEERKRLGLPPKSEAVSGTAATKPDSGGTP